ncbi:MAG: DUF3015 family protein [Leptospiraceae bacterium]|nr:DUF3015 family protein [Leptospiraceae bacterium]MCP5495151.1 DUF3015 family protein [Leptospiraceae bacterium]
MKNYYIFILFSLFCTLSIPAQNYGRAGCGPGSMIFGSYDSGWAQILVSTTNRGFGASYFSTTLDLQTSAILTGTSNCTEDGIVLKEKEQEVFVHLNYENLGQEIAVGKGEKLATLAVLFGCLKTQDQFIEMTKKNYSKLFSQQENPSKLYFAIKSEIQNNKILKNSCRL